MPKIFRLSESCTSLGICGGAGEAFLGLFSFATQGVNDVMVFSY